MKKYYKSFFITKQYIINIPEGMTVEDFQKWEKENLNINFPESDTENGIFINDYSSMKYSHPLSKQEVRKLKGISEPKLNISRTANTLYDFNFWKNYFLENNYEQVANDDTNITFKVKCPYGQFWITIDKTEELSFDSIKSNTTETISIRNFNEINLILKDYADLWNSLSYPIGEKQ